MKFVINGRLDGLNEYINACRDNKYRANTMKRENEFMVFIAIKQAKLKKVTKYPVCLHITFYEPNYRRDLDNISFATKFILDALVKSGVLEDDGQKYVGGLEYEFKKSKENPRIEVELIEK